MVEVFITHMLMKNDMHMNAPTMIAAEAFTFDTTDKASRLCNPDRCIASAKIKPPKNKKIYGFA